MANPILSAEVRENLAELNTALALYAAATGKSAASILAKKGDFISYKLYRSFRNTTPRAGEILAAAAARGWKMGREKNSIAGISKTAWKKAEALLMGKPSILAKTSPDGRISPVWAGRRGGITKGQNRGRSRTIGGKSAIDAYAGVRVRFFDPVKGRFVMRRRAFRLRTASDVATALGVKVLGRRAVATAMEAGLREQGRGFLGASWLHKRWREFAKVGYVPKGTAGLAPGWGPSKQFGGVEKVLTRNNQKNKLVGRASMRAGAQFAQLRFESFSEGMEKPRFQGIIARVMRSETADTAAYLISTEAKRLSSQVSSELKRLQSQ